MSTPVPVLEPDAEPELEPEPEPESVEVELSEDTTDGQVHVGTGALELVVVVVTLVASFRANVAGRAVTIPPKAARLTSDLRETILIELERFLRLEQVKTND